MRELVPGRGGVRADEKKAILAAVKCIEGNDDMNKTPIHRSAAFYI